MERSENKVKQKEREEKKAIELKLLNAHVLMEKNGLHLVKVEKGEYYIYKMNYEKFEIVFYKSFKKNLEKARKMFFKTAYPNAEH